MVQTLQPDKIQTEKLHQPEIIIIIIIIITKKIITRIILYIKNSILKNYTS